MKLRINKNYIVKCPKCGYDKPIKQINPECPFNFICGKCPEVFN